MASDSDQIRKETAPEPDSKEAVSACALRFPGPEHGVSLTGCAIVRNSDRIGAPIDRP